MQVFLTTMHNRHEGGNGHITLQAGRGQRHVVCSLWLERMPTTCSDGVHAQGRQGQQQCAQVAACCFHGVDDVKRVLMAQLPCT
jgi:hypothetical protein